MTLALALIDINRPIRQARGLSEVAQSLGHRVGFRGSALKRFH